MTFSMDQKKYIHRIFEFLDQYHCIDVRAREKQTSSPIPFASQIHLLNESELNQLKRRGFSNELGKSLMDKIEIHSNEILSTKPTLIFDDSPEIIAKAIWQHYRPKTDLYIYSGGLKSLLEEANQIFKKPYKLFTLYGETGVGKTDLLMLLTNEGQQTLNLEGIANHNGSTFGNLQNYTQPSQETFTIRLAETLARFSVDKPVFVESEKVGLGKNMIPLLLSEALDTSKKIRITLSKEERIERLVKEYANINDLKLKEGIEKLKFRIGQYEANEILKLLEKKDYHKVARHLIEYFDRSESYQSIDGNEFELTTDNSSPRDCANQILENLT